jgi:hypothetical protein
MTEGIANLRVILTRLRALRVEKRSGNDDCEKQRAPRYGSKYERGWLQPQQRLRKGTDERELFRRETVGDVEANGHPTPSSNFMSASCFSTRGRDRQQQHHFAGVHDGNVVPTQETKRLIDAVNKEFEYLLRLLDSASAPGVSAHAAEDGDGCCKYRDRTRKRGRRARLNGGYR